MEVELTGQAGIRTGEAITSDGRFFVSVRVNDGDSAASIVIVPSTALGISWRLFKSAMKGLLFKS